MDEDVTVPILDNFTSMGNFCANNSNIVQLNTPTSLWDVENFLYVGYMSISFLLGIPGNTLVLIILISSKSRNNTDWYIIFISIFGITGLLSEVPLSIIMRTSLWKSFGFPSICHLTMYLNYISQCTQALLFSGLSFERYRCVSKSNNVKTNIETRRGLVVSLILTVLVILLTTPTVVLNWDITHHTCSVASGKQTLQIIFFGGLTTIFIILFTSSIISYALVLMSLYKSQRRLSLIQKAAPRPKMINIRPTKMGKVGVAVTEASSTLNERRGKTSTTMNAQMFIPSNIRHKDTSSPLHTVEPSTLVSSKTSRGTRLQDFRPVISSSNVTIVNELNKRIYLERKRNGSIGRQNLSKRSNRLSKPNTNRRSSMKRTTLIIFLTTLTCILSWLPVITLAFIWSSIEREYLNSRSMAYTVLFMRKFHFINNFANPILYLTLHTEVRQRTKILLCGSQSNV